MKKGIFRESGWKAEVKIIEDKSNEEEERYVLEVVKTLRPSPYFGARPDGDTFEVFANRQYRHYVDWQLSID
ncbi:hypothetical protein SAMN04487895_104247 [Paenibacillus sophorae]|uniref:Uncharacterized protein n=1 Tax=Paenibacillus sophorae TaxID=1333845 RepID=A0A1H8L9R9_9BACL|nr:hypothetical protein [Paenibacillus sophorae]QWU17369.1 hypothetical protein KP014_09565 [Paenibacillus sophorae]SEO01885.1 hypothetical protein SAMN04487895_104247 [Paenibacillus sophorae]